MRAGAVATPAGDLTETALGLRGTEVARRCLTARAADEVGVSVALRRWSRKDTIVPPHSDPDSQITARRLTRLASRVNRDPGPHV